MCKYRANHLNNLLIILKNLCRKSFFFNFVKFAHIETFKKNYFWTPEFELCQKTNLKSFLLQIFSHKVQFE